MARRIEGVMDHGAAGKFNADISTHCQATMLLLLTQIDLP